MQPKITTGPDDESALLSMVQSAASDVLTAHTPEQAKSAEKVLAGLAQKAGGSPAVMSIILSVLSSARSKIEQLEQEQFSATTQRIAEERFLIDAHTQKLYDGLTDPERGIMTRDELDYINGIDPNKVYQIATFDQNGNLVEGQLTTVTGAELRESTIILKAHANRHLLTKEEKVALNIKLHGTKEDASTLKHFEDEANALKGHAIKKYGHKYSLASTKQEQDAVIAEFKVTRSLIEQWPVEKNPAIAADVNYGSKEKTLQTQFKGLGAVKNPDNFTVTADIQKMIHEKDGQNTQRLNKVIASPIPNFIVNKEAIAKEAKALQDSFKTVAAIDTISETFADTNLQSSLPLPSSTIDEKMLLDGFLASQTQGSSSQSTVAIPAGSERTDNDKAQTLLSSALIGTRITAPLADGTNELLIAMAASSHNELTQPDANNNNLLSVSPNIPHKRSPLSR